MTKVGRKGTMAWIAAVIAITAGPANANDAPIAPPDQREPSVVLHLVNYAALSGDVLNKAKDRVAMVYQNIGVRTVWVDSERPVRKHQDGGLHLTVVLLSRDLAQKKISAEGVGEDVLGQALRTHGRAYIFCDRI